jgi:hypothetical protein
MKTLPRHFMESACQPLPKHSTQGLFVKLTHKWCACKVYLTAMKNLPHRTKGC